MRYIPEVGFAAIQWDDAGLISHELYDHRLNGGLKTWGGPENENLVNFFPDVVSHFKRRLRRSLERHAIGFNLT